MALEWRIGTSERNLAEADQQEFDKDDGAGDQDCGVKQRGGPSPEKKNSEEGSGSQPGQREKKQNAPRDGSGVLLIGIEPVAEDPVGAKVGGHPEGEANANNDAISQDEREFGGRGRSGNERAKIGHRGKSFRGEDQSQSGASQQEMAIAAQERPRDEVIAGALRRGAKKRFVKGS